MDISPGIKRTDSVYTDAVDGLHIRLLRFHKDPSGVFVGKLQTFRLASAPHYFTVSYVWGPSSQSSSKTFIQLPTGPLRVLSSLVPFLHMVTAHPDFSEKMHWWTDSICIDLENTREREMQVRIMAEIYRRSRRVIVWLGEEREEGSDCTGAIEFLHYLATLQIAFSGDDVAMRRNLENPEFVAKCTAVSRLLERNWWKRVWTLQEFVLPKEAKLYCGSQSITRGKFKSAVYSIFLCSTISKDFENQIVPRKAFDGAFNRRRIHQWLTKPDSRGIGLIAIMAYLGNHLATDSRDRIYSVLGLITDRDRKMVGVPEYHTSTETQFARLVRSYWNEYKDLDIICFAHLFSRYTGPFDPGPESTTPSWAPDWRAKIDFASPVPLMASQSANENIGNYRPLRSSSWKAVYDAPGPHLRSKAHVHFSEDLKEMWCDGVILGTIHALGGLDERELRCDSFVCAASGHNMLPIPSPHPPALHAPQPQPPALHTLEAIARSLVLNRQDKYLCYYAPPHYTTDFLHLCLACLVGSPVDWTFATWFSLNQSLFFGERTLQSLVYDARNSAEKPVVPPSLHRPPSYPMHQRAADTGQNQRQSQPDSTEADKLDTFLSRFHDTVRKKARRLMVTREGGVGVAPCRAREGDVVVVLGGCRIPLVMRELEKGERSKEGYEGGWQVVGEAYMHGFMEGEVMGGLERGGLRWERLRLV